MFKIFTRSGLACLITRATLSLTSRIFKLQQSRTSFLVFLALWDIFITQSDIKGEVMFWGDKAKITESNIISSHKHRMSEIVVCMSNTGHHDIAGEMFAFKRGRTFFLPELIPHQAIGSKDEPAEIAFICFDLHTDIEHLTPAVHKIIKDLNKNRQYASLNTESSEHNLELTEKIFKEISSHAPLNQAMTGALLSQLIINHSRSLTSIVEPEQNNYSAKIANLCSWISENYNSELSLDEAARHTGMSRSLLSRNFRQQTGMSLVEFIVSVRISNAIKLLTSTDKPINDIALECGFNNLGYFYRMFQRHTNATPRKLRTFVIETGRVPLI
jgi:AraC-like DNA-binding protein